jgi:hypothetical protein
MNPIFKQLQKNLDEISYRAISLANLGVNTVARPLTKKGIVSLS